MESSNRIKEWVKGHELYQKHCQKIIEKSHFLKRNTELVFVFIFNKLT